MRLDEFFELLPDGGRYREPDDCTCGNSTVHRASTQQHSTGQRKYTRKLWRCLRISFQLSNCTKSDNLRDWDIGPTLRETEGKRTQVRTAAKGTKSISIMGLKFRNASTTAGTLTESVH